jgi:hypothetical protein
MYCNRQGIENTFGWILVSFTENKLEFKIRRVGLLHVSNILDSEIDKLVVPNKDKVSEERRRQLRKITESKGRMLWLPKL